MKDITSTEAASRLSCDNDVYSENFASLEDEYFRSEVNTGHKWPAARRAHISLRELKMVNDNRAASGGKNK